MSRRAKRTSSIIYNMVGTPIFGGSIFRDRMTSRDNGLERQCRYYCTRCKLLVAYRQSPPGESSPSDLGLTGDG